MGKLRHSAVKSPARRPHGRQLLEVPSLPCFLQVNPLSFFLAAPCGLRDLSSPTRDRTCTLGNESAESYPLDCQGIPKSLVLSQHLGLDHFLIIRNILILLLFPLWTVLFAERSILRFLSFDIGTMKWFFIYNSTGQDSCNDRRISR